MRRIVALTVGIGWFVACGNGEPDLACTERGEADCLADSSCLVLEGGQVVDALCDSNQGPATFQGCIDDVGGCDDVITVATAPDGTQYRFDDDCVPDDFTDAGACQDSE